MSTSSQRAVERVAVEAFVIVIGERAEEWVFRTRDVSEQGLFLFTRVARTYPLRLGQTVQLELHDYAEPLRLRAIVARIVESGSTESHGYPTGLGLRIVDADSLTRDRLRSLVTNAKRDGAPY